MYWKIKNISDQPRKVGIALASNKAPGIILQPNEFVIALPKMTTMLDAQSRRGFVEIEEDYENKLQFPLGMAIDKEEEMDIDEIKEMIKKFKK
jgi:hypothetical protein